LAQTIHDEFVMHHFMAHINRRAVQSQRAFNDHNGAIHTGAKPRGLASSRSMFNALKTV